MSTTITRPNTLLDAITRQARTKTTPQLQDLYRESRDLGTPRVDVEVAVATVLRERTAAAWLHEHWCFMAEQCSEVETHLAGHEADAQRIVEAFQAHTRFVAAVLGALWPDTPATASRMRDLTGSASFRDLLHSLVAVVPAETAVAA